MMKKTIEAAAAHDRKHRAGAVLWPFFFFLKEGVSPLLRCQQHRDTVGHHTIPVQTRCGAREGI
jgi:hypothetical protein